MSAKTTVRTHAITTEMMLRGDGETNENLKLAITQCSGLINNASEDKNEVGLGEKGHATKKNKEKEISW